MKCNNAGIALIQSFEGCKLDAYKDTRGILTIGWGHTGTDVAAGMVWTQKQADDQFLDDLARRAENAVNQLNDPLTESLTGNQFAALCSLCYNIGSGNFRASSVYHLVESCSLDGVPEKIMLWDHNHDGSISAGLQRRRQAEVDLWGTPDEQVSS